MSHDRIDVHTHVIPPVWGDALDAHGGDPSGWKSPEWTPQLCLDFMDKQQIKTSVLSVTAPSVQGWKGQAQLDMARQINEYTASLVQKQPDRFGNFATLPLPNIEGSLKEVEYSFETLKADGVVILSNYNDRYLGEEEYDPLWAELNRRSAVVFIHPGKPEIPVMQGLPMPLCDYPYDTTRTAMNMVLKGVMKKYTKMKVILSHAGGFLPYASYRFAYLWEGLNKGAVKKEDTLEEFRSFYFDTALSSSPASLPSLMAFAKPGHVLYGSDFPYAPAWVGAEFAKLLDAYTGFKGDEFAQINRKAAEVLFPRLAK